MSLQQRPVSEADSYSAGQGISCPLLNPNRLRIMCLQQPATGP